MCATNSSLDEADRDLGSSSESSSGGIDLKVGSRVLYLLTKYMVS